MKPGSSVANQRPEFSVPFSQFAEMPKKYGFVGLQILAPLPVTRQSGDYYVEELESVLRDDIELELATGAAPKRVDFQFEEVSYRTKELALESLLPDRMVAAFPDLPSAEATTAKNLWKIVMRYIERRLVQTVTNQAVIANSPVDVTWRNHGTADPLADVQRAILNIYEATGLQADTVVMSFHKLIDLIQVDEIVDRLKHSGHVDPSPSNLFRNLNALAQALNVERVLISGAIHNTADKGQPAAVSSFWNPGDIGVYVTASGNSPVSEPCIGRTPTWGGDGASIGTGDEPDIVIESYRDEKRRSEVFRSRAELDFNGGKTGGLIYPKAGYLLTGAHAVPTP